MKIRFAMSKIAMPYWHYRVKKTEVFKVWRICMFIKWANPRKVF